MAGYYDASTKLISGIRNYPVEVEWMGWKSDTQRLQQAGWSINAFQDPMRRMLGIAIDHPHVRACGMTAIREDFLHDAMMAYNGDLSQALRMCGSRGAPLSMTIGKDIMYGHSPNQNPFSDWNPVDAEPQFMQYKVSSLRDLCQFAEVPKARTQQLILPEATVDDLLKEIIAKQDPAQVEYYNNLRMMNSDPGIDKSKIIRPKFEAQIISLPRAA